VPHDAFEGVQSERASGTRGTCGLSHVLCFLHDSVLNVAAMALERTIALTQGGRKAVDSPNQ